MSKPKPSKPKNNHRVVGYVDEETAQRLQVVRDRAGYTESQAVREALKLGLAKLESRTLAFDAVVEHRSKMANQGKKVVRDG